MSQQSVVISGIGLVTPLGLDRATHFQAWLAGESAVQVSSNQLFDSYAHQIEARVKNFPREELIANRVLRKLLSPSAGYAVGAVGATLRDAGIQDDLETLKYCGLYVGSLSLEIDPKIFIPPLKASLTPEGEFDISLFAKRGMKLLDPLFLVRALPNAGLGGISVQHQVLGPNTNLTNGTCSGLMAIELAAAAIRRGEADCALAGGYDTLLGMDSIAEHLIAGRLSMYVKDPSQACRPFDCERDGYALGEAAAFIFLESAEHARARGAHIYAEVLGCGGTADTSLIDPRRAHDPTALAQAAGLALQDGGCEVKDLGVVFGDGLGTEIDDLREASALHMVLNGTRVPFTAATSAIGFTGTASGVISLAHAALALEEGIVPALGNCQDPDPRCPVYFLTQAERRPYNRSLVWNSDRGIKNIAVLVGAYSA